ncbi:phage tail protein [Edwardsiella tarda]|uniref:phage tail protein n=1 Tax=Edwardsiella tarda TaxID=636 RepID=UPI0003080582|nr:phage tail protein [Edwardsiella tarda]
MNKPGSLRQALDQALPDLHANPDKLHLFVDDGSIICTQAASLSWEYRYTLNVIITDFVGDQNILMAVVIAWLRQHQPDLLANPDQRPHGFSFEAIIQSNAVCDLILDLRLTERVLAHQQDDTVMVATIDEPEPPQEYWLGKR